MGTVVTFLGKMQVVDNSWTADKMKTLTKEFGQCGQHKREDGTLYIGDVDTSGERTGVGHLELPTGVSYTGTFSKGFPNGFGVMKFPDKSCYEGEMMQGWFHGHGVFNAQPQSIKYEG